MKKEEVLAIKGLTKEQKARLETYFKYKERFGRKPEIDLNDEKEVIKWLDEVLKKDAKKKAKKDELAQFNADLAKTVKEAKSCGVSGQEILDAIKGIYIEKHNNDIDKQIEELLKKKL